MPGERVDRQRLTDILVDVGEDFVHLRVVAFCFFGAYCLPGIIGKALVQIDHQLQKNRFFQQIGAIPLDGGKLVDVIEKALLFLIREGDPMTGIFCPIGKAKVKVSLRRA